MQKSFLCNRSDFGERETEKGTNPVRVVRKNNKKDKKKKSPQKGRFSIEKDTLKGVLYAPFECVLMSIPNEKERLFKAKVGQASTGI